MPITPFDENLDIIQALADEPNDDDGLTADELKAKFDEAGNLIKGYLNDTLIPDTEEMAAETLQSANTYTDSVVVAIGAADMAKAIYDPTHRETDIFAAIDGVVSDVAENYFTRPQTFTEETALSLGLPPEAVPDDAFAKLSNAAFIRKLRRMGGKVSSFAEGSTFYMKEEGVLTPFIFNKHNYEPALNNNGRGHAVRKNIPYTGRFGNTNSLAGSDIDAWFNGIYLNKFSADVQAAIGTTAFYGTPVGGSTTVQSVTRAIFSMSLSELGLTSAQANIEGTALPNAESLRLIKTDAGAAISQITRTPQIGNTTQIWVIGATGNPTSPVTTSAGNGNRPSFTLPEDFEVVWYEDDNGYPYDNPYAKVAAETVLGEKVGDFMFMQQFEYTGTGIYGSGANMNVLITGFRPDLVIVQAVVNPAVGNFPWARPAQKGAVWMNPLSAVTLTWGNDRVSWYSDNVGNQMNTSGTKYVATVIGLLN